jgi:hypothetical protein
VSIVLSFQQAAAATTSLYLCRAVAELACAIVGKACAGANLGSRVKVAKPKPEFEQIRGKAATKPQRDISCGCGGRAEDDERVVM